MVKQNLWQTWSPKCLECIQHEARSYTLVGTPHGLHI